MLLTTICLAAALSMQAPATAQPMAPATPTVMPGSMPVLNLAPGTDGRDVLLAVRSGEIIAIRTYPVDGNLLRYRTFERGHNTIDMSLIDMERTRRLNTDRKITFPAPYGAADSPEDLAPRP